MAGVRLEIKYDRKVCLTGNVAVEYHNPRTGKATGLFSTLSDCWVYVLDCPSGCWLVGVAELKDYFLHGKAVRDVVRAGDGNASVRLFPVADFLEKCVRLDSLPPHLLADVLGGG